MRDHFLETSEADEDLEAANEVFWECLIDHISSDLGQDHPHVILDIGCHHGGLLARLAEQWRPACAYGIEPLDTARRRTAERLSLLVPNVCIVAPDEWDRIPDACVDLVT